jgi:NAD(P)H dehydrogenase (quinone)
MAAFASNPEYRTFERTQTIALQNSLPLLEGTTMNANIAIVYHSGYGHTKKLAEAVLAGARQVADVDATLIAIDAEGNVPEDTWARLDSADAIVFGSPTYMGNASWQFKKFADASSKVWFTQGWKDKLFAGFTNSASMNGDKFATVQAMMTLAMQHSGLWIGTGLMPSNKKASQRDDVNYLGSYSGLMAQSPSDSSPDEGPLPGDLATGRLFGARIAQTAKRVAVHELAPA